MVNYCSDGVTRRWLSLSADTASADSTTVDGKDYLKHSINAEHRQLFSLYHSINNLFTLHSIL
jgi:hypothetical protein